jgi:hypothetical protein
MNYTPSATLRAFMLDDAFFRVAVGPLGSGKSLAMIMELFRRAVQQAPDAQGVRPTRFAIIRSTRQQLVQTALADARAAFGPLAVYRVSETALHLRFPLGDGTSVESEWLFIPIDTPEDTRRVLSLNLTAVWVSEAREIPFEIVGALLGRCGRYPSKARVGPTWFGGIAETNPWSEGSDWHKNLVVTRPKDWSLYLQPGGMDPAAENLENLPGGRDYYARLCEGHGEDWIDVHVHARWGEDLTGQTVFRRSFVRRRHVVPELIVQMHRPLVIGLDLGRTPSAILTQEDAFGRFLALEEVLGSDTGLHQFLGEQLKPLLSGERYAGVRVVVCFDPAGMAKSQLREESAYDVLLEHGFLARPAPTNDIAPRLRALESLFLANRGDSPAFLVDETRAPVLTASLAYDYKYRRKKDGSLENEPEKKHPTSDIVDACQYAALGTRLGVAARAVDSMRRNYGSQRPVVSPAGWT